MTFTTSDVFLDSSILVEYERGSRTDLLDHLIDENYRLYISEVVLSEFTFHLLALKGLKAPLTLKVNRQIGPLLAVHSRESQLAQFTVLPNGNEIIPEYLRLMQHYNLLPNDALILATCRLHGIPQLASHDTTDFGPACTGEGIRLVGEVGQLV
jgi:predicted nucleic acid-binding protein